MRAVAVFLLLAALELPGDTRPPPRPAPASRAGFQVRVQEPAENAIVTGQARIRAVVTVDDPSQILHVTFFVGEERILIDTEPPFATVYDFGEQPRSVVVRAVATHRAGFSVEHSTVTRALRLSYAVEVHRVVLTVSAVDGSGSPATGLSREQFRVREDGAEQEILELVVEERPLRIAVVLDTSGSMRRSLPEVQMAATSFLDVLRPDDRAMVVDFDDQVILLQDLTASRENLRAALMSTFARGGTAMYDAIHATLRRLAPQQERKAIVLLSDGGDTASVIDRTHSLEAARTADVLIYAIGLDGADNSVLKELSRETGGKAFSAGKASDLAGVYQRIAAELRHQYVLVYSSSNPEYDGKWRKIEVDYEGPGDVRVQARRGYYAVRDEASPLDAPAPGPTVTAPAAAEPAAGEAAEVPPGAGSPADGTPAQGENPPGEPATPAADPARR